MTLDPASILRRRLHEQRLTGEPFATPVEAVRWSGAVQAQEHAEALWSLGMRLHGHDEAAVQAACDRGEIIRTHILRPTWHFVAADDLRWMLRLTGPRVMAKTAGRLRDLGLDDATLARIYDVLSNTLADGEPRTRRELSAVLQAAGIDPSGQRIAHAVGQAELSGVLCSGPRRGWQHTYVPLDDRVPPAPERAREDDVAELALRFFRSHGPATLRDFAWWSGLTIADGRTGVAAVGDALESVDDERGTPWIAAAGGSAAPPDPPAALLLGTYDEIVVAYRDLRTVGLDGTPGTELRQRPIFLNGRAAGGWTRRIGAREVVVAVQLHAPPTAAQQATLQTEAERFGAFIGLPARLEVLPG
jgi:hypothetical protein